VDAHPSHLKGSSAARHPRDHNGHGGKRGLGDSTVMHSSSVCSLPDEDCTTLCILAVPSYMSPSDFLGFVGEQTRDDVSHFRMIKTARANRYMVLMKFRSGRKARDWQREWNGKVFNSMEVSFTARSYVEKSSLANNISSRKLAMSSLSSPWRSRSRLRRLREC
jgi:BRCA1-associated protein